MEHDRLVATRSTTPSFHKPGPKEVITNLLATPAQKTARAARFASHARNMGISNGALVAQKVDIWEGMHAAKQNGDSIGVSAPYRAPFVGCSEIFAD